MLRMVEREAEVAVVVERRWREWLTETLAVRDAVVRATQGDVWQLDVEASAEERGRRA